MDSSTIFMATLETFWWVALIALVVGTITLVIHQLWPDDNDRKLEREEALRAKRLQEKLEAAPPAQTLADFYDKYDEIPAKDRMGTLMKPAEDTSTPWHDELLTKYQLTMVIDFDKGVARFVDRKYFELKNKVVERPLDKVLGADYRDFRSLVVSVRYQLNARAKRTGTAPTKQPKARAAAS